MTGLRLLAGVGAMLAATAACGGSVPESAPYTFHPSGAAMKVDTPQLRKMKAAAGIAPCPPTGPADPAPAGGLPELTLPCLGGGRDVRLSGLRGPLVLNFWAQTCGPCREESPLLQSLWAKDGATVRVMGVDFFDPRPAYALAFAREHGLTYPQVADPDAASKADLHVAGLPTTLFIDRAGRVAYTQVGAIESPGQLHDLILEHLGVAVPAARPAPAR